ncbi:MAG: hypothetical protein OSJ62_02105 [Lachnospiraceae bacterium]|nr:hypothetical protein [Lachnospiraceae bacterium]
MGVKMPPIEKIHEAYSAIADGRVVLKEGEAEVVSSDLTKKYLVTWKEEVYTSNDNASYWQGYLGYPILAVLMLQGKLSLDLEIAAYFKGIPWKVLNTEYKNRFSEAVKKILTQFEAEGLDCDKINAEIDKVYHEIEELKISTKRSALRPPK